MKPANMIMRDSKIPGGDVQKRWVCRCVKMSSLEKKIDEIFFVLPEVLIGLFGISEFFGGFWILF